MSSFLDLPAELRNQVYGYIAIPHTVPLSSYIGLYLSCRQIRTEMDSECAKVFRQYLGTFQYQLQDAHLDMPETFAEMQHVRLHVTPITASNLVRWFDESTALFPLHLASLSIIHDFSEELPLSRQTSDLILLLGDEICDQLTTGAAKSEQIRIESLWSSEEAAKAFIHRHPGYEFQTPEWTFSWEVGSEGALCGLWKK